MMNLFLTTLAVCAVILTIASAAPEKRAYGMCYANGYVHQNGDVFTIPGGSHCFKYRCMNGQVNFHEQMCEVEGKCYPMGVNFEHNCVTYTCQRIDRDSHIEMKPDVVRYDGNDPGNSSLPDDDDDDFGVDGKYSSVTGPLMLTPLIEEGLFDAAHYVSKVKATPWNHLPSSHSGFITVDKILGNHLHFWFFPSETNPNAPLMVWINGGPTVTSMLGLFWSHGPVYSVKASRGKGYQFQRRTTTWVGPFSIVYVDMVGDGYSFSDSGEDGYKFTQTEYTADLHEFVKQFVQLFSEYKTRGVYIAGQSYAGHYVPALAHALHTEIENGNSDIKLSGVILGSPIIYPQIQDLARYDYLYAVGAISEAFMLEVKENITKLHDKVMSGWNPENMTLMDVYGVLLPEPGFNGMMDNYVTSAYPDENPILHILNQKSTRQYLHVGLQPFNMFNPSLYQKFGPDYFEGTRDKLGELMSKYKVLIYNGDQDLVISSVSVESAILSIPWSSRDKYSQAWRTIWKTNDQTTDVKGFYSRTDKFCRVEVHGAGHQVPHEQPEISLEMVKEFLSSGCITDCQ